MTTRDPRLAARHRLEQLELTALVSRGVRRSRRRSRLPSVASATKGAFIRRIRMSPSHFFCCVWRASAPPACVHNLTGELEPMGADALTQTPWAALLALTVAIPAVAFSITRRLRRRMGVVVAASVTAHVLGTRVKAIRSRLPRAQVRMPQMPQNAKVRCGSVSPGAVHRYSETPLSSRSRKRSGPFANANQAHAFAQYEQLQRLEPSSRSRSASKRMAPQ